MRHAFIMTRHLLILLAPLLAASCASVDKGMMSVSNAVSSPDPVTGRREINLESEENEIARATNTTNQILDDVKKEGIKVDGETKQYERVTAVFNRLKNVVHRRNLPWEVHVVENDEWQAFTIGGGKVFVYTGLFEGENGIQSDDELAAVLAHEMAHVAARHASERQGKMAISQLADKKLRTDMYEASFTTNQESEADKYSVIYSALAGYNPSASVEVWQRWQSAVGNYTGTLLYDHPLNDDRARNMQQYSQLAMQYYTPGVINVSHDSILPNNAVFSYVKNPDLNAGEGGGALAVLETLTNAYTESLEAKIEQKKRLAKQYEQQNLASRQIIFSQLQIANAQDGGKGLFGNVRNATATKISESIVSIKYWSGKQLIHEEKMRWPAMQAYEQRQFGIPLKPILYTGVTISPEYAHLDDEL